MNALFDALGLHCAFFATCLESHGIQAHVNAFASVDINLVGMPRTDDTRMPPQVLYVSMQERPTVVIASVIHAAHNAGMADQQHATARR
jgi:hypothetical protein